MKIGDVEFQGDGTKAIFYYIADGRVDFRQLIKVFAEEFRIRIEMKQIGAGQKPESLRTEPEPYIPEFVTAVGDDSITRFDAPKRKRSRSRKKNRQGRKQGDKQ